MRRGAPFTAQYVNAGANTLAILPIDGETRSFANVVSGSGARYASGQYIWLSKGANATLENELEEGSLKDCVSKDFLAAE
ncbi:MliC family protein [Paracoccus sp. IB05]|uniref:MliC family protein n=1 Tax=Paracoccus sp. IB05 TaxID=2779367 RepID=UPI0021032A3E|nr:MliC family protein [Paracoccus sp. IB05]